MQMSDWIGLIGGISGLLSLVIVAYEKYTKKPKVKLEIISSSMRESKPTSMDSFFNYFIDIEIEIGNSGNEMTSAVRTSLEISKLDIILVCKYKNDRPLDFGDESLQLEPGFASPFRFGLSIRSEKRIQEDELDTKLRIKLLNSKTLIHPVRMKIRRDS